MVPVKQVIVTKPRQSVTLAWCEKQEPFLTANGLRVACGLYTKDTVIIAACAAGDRNG